MAAYGSTDATTAVRAGRTICRILSRGGRETIPAFEKLAAWRKAHDLALSVYDLSECLPTEERYALRDQIRRAAVAIPANVAEGHGRGNGAEFAYFLRVAVGSLAELQSLLLLARDIGYISADALHDFWPQAAEAGRVLEALLDHVRAQG
ncbi:MAG: four helix bundle protein [Armatimonadota bacterium]|nr:four helix bundle protein [Armatimonadota bacterium]